MILIVSHEYGISGDSVSFCSALLEWQRVNLIDYLLLGNKLRKIFNVSLHRSGTQSFVKFCRVAGLKVQHWPGYEFDEMCAPALSDLNCRFVWSKYAPFVKVKDAFADLPMPFVYRYAFENHPDSHFLLLTRPIPTWIESVRKQTGNRDLDVMEKLQYWKICFTKRNRLSRYNDTELGEAYKTHEQNVIDFMKKNNALFSMIRLNDPGISDQLKSIIGIQDKHVEFEKVDANK